MQYDGCNSRRGFRRAMTSIYTLLLVALPTLGFAAALVLLHRRSRAARQRLAQEIHDRALAFDQRADLLERRLDRLEMHQRIDRVEFLVDHGERNGQLSAALAERLRTQTLKLHEECSE